MKEEILQANARFAREGTPPGLAALSAAPARRLAVLSCMDARIDVYRALGLELGQAHVIRNAGGRASDDAIRSLVISSRALGTREVVVVHHTECGMHGEPNDEFRARLVADGLGAVPDIDYMPFDDLDQSVRDDVARIAAAEGMAPGMRVVGFVYDVATGLLREVSMQ